MADLELRSPGPNSSAFSVGPAQGYQLTAAEKAWCDRTNGILLQLSKLGADKNTPVSPAALAVRDEFVKLLREGAVTIIALSKPDRDREAEQALYDTYWDEGVYNERLVRANLAIFKIEPVVEQNTQYVSDIQILTSDVPIPADKQKFKVQIDKTLTIMKAVLADRDVDVTPPPAGSSKILRFKFALKSITTSVQTGTQIRRSEYLKALIGIARVGLSNLDTTQTPFAILALSGLQDEFVAREAGKVKNRYVRKLGWHAFWSLLVAVAFYTIAVTFVPRDWIAYRFRNFFLLAAGAAVGTWLSFSIRRTVLGFWDLATLEDDRLNPGVRVLFMVALTTVVGLILWTGMVTIVVGGFRTDFRLTGSNAALIGALCGIAERSLAGAVGRRAGEFAAGIGGESKTAA